MAVHHRYGVLEHRPDAVVRRVQLLGHDVVFALAKGLKQQLR